MERCKKKKKLKSMGRERWLKIGQIFVMKKGSFELQHEAKLSSLCKHAEMRWSCGRREQTSQQQ